MTSVLKTVPQVTKKKFFTAAITQSDLQGDYEGSQKSKIC